MEIQLYEEAKKIWRIISESPDPPDLALEMEIHKKVLDFFQVGDFYYFIFNLVKGELDYMHEGITRVLGYHPKEVSIQGMMEWIHPDDLPWFMDFENTVVEFFFNLPPEKVLLYKVRYDIRLRKANGEYVRILQQSIPIQADEKGVLLRSLVVHTDISHLKTIGPPTLSLVSLDTREEDLIIPVKKVLSPVGIHFTRREKEILQLMVSGLTRRQIADELSISKATVDQHYKNMLKKTGLPNSANMLIKAVQEGWL
jgi:DNA-binding CsgD family transcriptional regulator